MKGDTVIKVYSEAFLIHNHWKKNGVILTQKIESLAELKFDPEMAEIKFQFIRYCESIWLKYYPTTRNPLSNFSSASDSIF